MRIEAMPPRVTRQLIEGFSRPFATVHFDQLGGDADMQSARAGDGRGCLTCALERAAQNAVDAHGAQRLREAARLLAARVVEVNSWSSSGDIPIHGIVRGVPNEKKARHFF